MLKHVLEQIQDLKSVNLIKCIYVTRYAKTNHVIKNDFEMRAP